MASIRWLSAFWTTRKVKPRPQTQRTASQTHEIKHDEHEPTNEKVVVTDRCKLNQQEQREVFHDACEPTFSALLLLPLELRQKIYVDLLPGRQLRRREHIKRYKHAENHFDLPPRPDIVPLMLTCRMLYHDVLTSIPQLTSLRVVWPCHMGRLLPRINPPCETWWVHTSTEARQAEPLWHVHPSMRGVNKVEGNWNIRVNSVGMSMIPSISLEVLVSNPLGWQKVVMNVNVSIPNDAGGAEGQLTSTQRVSRALAYQRDWKGDLTEILKLGERDGLSVSVRFAVADQKIGEHIGVVVVCGGKLMSIVKLHKSLPNSEELWRIFSDVFCLGAGEQ